jgi:hypothetical protein
MVHNLIFHELIIYPLNHLDSFGIEKSNQTEKIYTFKNFYCGLLNILGGLKSELKMIYLIGIGIGL